MNLEFKFTFTNFVAFFVLAGLFYWLCPLPSAALGRAVVCGLVGLALFFMCFVVVSHRGFIRPAAPDAAVKKHKHKK